MGIFLKNGKILETGCSFSKVNWLHASVVPFRSSSCSLTHRSISHHFLKPTLRNGVWLYLSVQFSRSVKSDSLRPHEPQHARPPCPSPSPGVHPNPCPLSPWCIQPSHPPSSPSPPAPNPNPSPASVFSNESTPRMRFVSKVIQKQWSSFYSTHMLPKLNLSVFY